MPLMVDHHYILHYNVRSAKSEKNQYDHNNG